MHRAALLLAAALVTAPTASHADECAAVERETLVILKAFDVAGQRAVVIGNRCMFHGNDAKAVTQLEAATRRAFRRLDTMRDPAPGCVRAGSFADAMRAHGQAFGLRVGLAWSLCAPEVTATIAALQAQGVAADQIRTRIDEMSQAWIQTLSK